MVPKQTFLMHFVFEIFVNNAHFQIRTTLLIKIVLRIVISVHDKFDPKGTLVHRTLGRSGLGHFGQGPFLPFSHDFVCQIIYVKPR